MKFTKMQATGNDYIYLYEMGSLDCGALAKKISPRGIGVGSDGVIHIRRGTEGRFRMEMYNADGSEGAMCGNGIRCVGKYLYEGGYTRETQLNIETKAGIRALELHLGQENQVEAVTVNMGKASEFQEMQLMVGKQKVEGCYVSMGNPHFVIFCEDVQEAPVKEWGSILERHPDFPQDGVNVEFYSPTEEGFAMRVWERGSGETLSCGTGACACYVVGQHLGTLDPGKQQAFLPGGCLEIWQEGCAIFLKGEAVTVYQGEL